MAGRRRGQRPRVVVVAQAAPAQGGIASFADALVAAPGDLAEFDMQLLNTTRQAVRVGGEVSVGNAWNAIVDSWRVFRAARDADIVHVQTALMPMPPLVRAVALCTAARLGGARVICHVHSGRVNSGRAEAFTPSRTTRLALRGLAVSHLVLTCADAGTAALRELVPHVSVETVDNPVDVDAFRPATKDPNDVVVLFVGTLSRRKGLGDLAAAVSLLRERGVDGWRLEVVGGANEVGDAEADSLRAAIRDAGFGDALIGPLSGQPLRDRLASAAIFVLPSHWEGQPIALLEAMASGAAVVATRVGAIPDVVRDGVDGLLVEPHRPADLADALHRLIKDADERGRLAASARARVEDGHTFRAFGGRVAAVYRSLLAG